MNAKSSIIVVKKRAAHAGHPGGAWKVAYADFVTAMMALFIVLWLMNSSKKVQLAVSSYFKDPSGVLDKGAGNSPGSNEKLAVSQTNMGQLKEELERAVRKVPHFDKLQNHIEMTITPEGLRIELLESANGTFFDIGSPEPNKDGQDILMALSDELGKIPNKLAIEGHTDSKPYSQRGNYGNWELSADRANAARRLLQKNGIHEDQVTQVRGFSDQRPRKPDAPLDPSNRRVAVIVQYPSGTQEPNEPDSSGNMNGTNPPDAAPAKAVSTKQ